MNFTQLENILMKKIPHAKVEIIGLSVLKRQIYSISFDMGHKNTVIIQAGIHAREHITANLVMKQVFEVSENFEKYKALEIPNLVFVPLSNPDGAELVTKGLSSVKSFFYKRKLKKINGGSKDFSLFKANANGVDLNNNFDAKWGRMGDHPLSASSHGYIGPSPMSEPCTKALALLTVNTKPIFTISYHTKGEEVYFDFFNKKENLERDKKIAKMIAKNLRYCIKSTQSYSSGGYKDWCISKFHIPAVTIEVGSDSLTHPIAEEFADELYKRNKGIIKLLAKVSKEYENAKRRLDEKSTDTCKKSIQKG